MADEDHRPAGRGEAPRRSRAAARARLASSDEVGSSRITSRGRRAEVEKAMAISTICRSRDREVVEPGAGLDAVAGEDRVEHRADRRAGATAPAQAADAGDA